MMTSDKLRDEPSASPANQQTPVTGTRLYLPRTSSEAYPFIADVHELNIQIETLTANAMELPKTEDVIEGLSVRKVIVARVYSLGNEAMMMTLRLCLTWYCPLECLL